MSKKKNKAKKFIDWQDALHDVASEQGAAAGRDIALRAALLLQLRHHVGPDVALEDVTPTDIQSFLGSLPADLAPTGREAVQALLGAIDRAGGAR